MLVSKALNVVSKRAPFIVGVLLACSACIRGQAQTAATSPPNGAAFRPIDASPQIIALKQRLDSGDRLALTQFWQDAARTGTPLIEPASESPHEVIVTFIWRGDPDTENVGLLAPLAKTPGMPNFPLTRLLNTDLWYKSWQMRDDLRFTYRFAPNVTATDKYSQQDPAVDPLNPRRMEISYDEGAKAIEFSIAALPRGAEPQWIVKQQDSPAGTVELHAFKSATLGNERKIWVYTPPGYDANAHDAYRLLVLFDGLQYQSWIPTPTILDNLIHAGKISPTVAVLIGNAPGARSSELEYNPAFAEFLGKELLPWIHKHWHVTRDPRKSIVGGDSDGGGAAAFVALRRPDLFGNVLSQSGSFWVGNDRENVKWEWLATAYGTSPKRPLRFFLEAGVLEDISKDGPTLLAANRHFLEVLQTKGYVVTYKEVGGTHEPVHWRGELADGLISLAN